METRYGVEQNTDGSYTVVLWHGVGDSSYGESMTQPIRSLDWAEDIAQGMNMARQQRLLDMLRKAGS